MKRTIVAMALAVGVVAASQQQASAWCKFNFGVGLNLGWECGGKCKTWTYNRVDENHAGWCASSSAGPVNPQFHGPACAAPATNYAPAPAPAPETKQAAAPVQAVSYTAADYNYNYNYGYNYNYDYAAAGYYWYGY
jgi:hypothetical protein